MPFTENTLHFITATIQVLTILGYKACMASVEGATALTLCWDVRARRKVSNIVVPETGTHYFTTNGLGFDNFDTLFTDLLMGGTAAYKCMRELGLLSTAKHLRALRTLRRKFAPVENYAFGMYKLMIEESAFRKQKDMLGHDFATFEQFVTGLANTERDAAKKEELLRVIEEARLDMARGNQFMRQYMKKRISMFPTYVKDELAKDDTKKPEDRKFADHPVRSIVDTLVEASQYADADPLHELFTVYHRQCTFIYEHINLFPPQMLKMGVGRNVCFHFVQPVWEGNAIAPYVVALLRFTMLSYSPILMFIFWVYSKFTSIEVSKMDDLWAVKHDDGSKVTGSLCSVYDNADHLKAIRAKSDTLQRQLTRAHEITLELINNALDPVAHPLSQATTDKIAIAKRIAKDGAFAMYAFKLETPDTLREDLKRAMGEVDSMDKAVEIIARINKELPQGAPGAIAYDPEAAKQPSAVAEDTDDEDLPAKLARTAYVSNVGERALSAPAACWYPDSATGATHRSHSA